MNNDIINFLNIIDKDIETIDVIIDDKNKYIHLQKTIIEGMKCPLCGANMYSKGIHIRKIKHPIFQDGFNLYFILHQRKWRCTNSSCNHYCNDSFNFVSKYKQSSNMLPFLILKEFKDINATDIAVAKRLNVSDTTVHNIFKQYVDIPRLKLTEVISIDEVYMKYDSKNLYSLVIMDFANGEIIDFLKNRLQETTYKYFHSISKEERENVKYLLCDMYNPYINFVYKYFKNAKCVIDSFHVIQWINRKLQLFINELKKKYRKIDQERLDEKNYKNNYDNKSINECEEMYLLNNFQFFLLSDKRNISYSYKRHYNRKFRSYLSLFDLERMFFSIDDRLKKYRDLKQIYHDFNNKEYNDFFIVESELYRIIKLYKDSTIDMFIEFANILDKNSEYIINSFNYVLVTDEKTGEVSKKRLSNGPMEAWNNKPKDYKRISNGVTDFIYTRNRILWANRTNAIPLGVPKNYKDICNYTGKKRGPYKK